MSSLDPESGRAKECRPNSVCVGLTRCPGGSQKMTFKYSVGRKMPTFFSIWRQNKFYEVSPSESSSLFQYSLSSSTFPLIQSRIIIEEPVNLLLEVERAFCFTVHTYYNGLTISGLALL